MDLLINNTKSTEDVYNDLLNTDSSTESLNHNTNELNFDDFILNEWSTNNDFLITQDITNNNCMSTTTTTNNNNQFTFNNTEISNLIHRTNSLSNSDNDSDSGVCSVSSKSFDSPEISNYNELELKSLDDIVIFFMNYKFFSISIKTQVNYFLILSNIIFP